MKSDKLQRERRNQAVQRFAKERHRGGKRHNGAVAVETAIVLPVFLLIIVAVFDLGLAVFRYNTLASAARRGIRQAIVHGSKAPPEATAWGPMSYSGAASDSTEIARAIRPRLLTFDPSDVYVQADWLDGDNEPDQRVRITLRYEQQAIVPALLGYPPLTLEATTSMRILH